jgi:iron complex transport system substrate-binding protein
MLRKIRPIFACFLIAGAMFLISISACVRGVGDHATSLVQTLPVSECRMVQHALGETCIPASPQRVIALDIFSLGSAINLGVRPIAGMSLRQEEIPQYLKNYVDDIQNIGVECQPDTEKIILLKPELLLGRSSCSQNYSLFSKIAPTVLSRWYIGTHWKENFEFASHVLGKEAVAHSAWDDYHQRITKLRPILAEKYHSKKISVVEVSQFQTIAYTKNAFSGSILNDLGLQRPDLQNGFAEYGYVEISDEETQKIDGDILFVLSDENDNGELVEKLKSRPLWSKLRATQTNRIYSVKNDVWWGGNLLAANLVLDDIEKYLFNTP